MFISSCVISACLIDAASAYTVGSLAVERPNTLYMDGEDMLYLRDNQEEISEAVDDIVKRANGYMKRELQTVSDKGQAPPFVEAELNDYFSFSPYWWKATEAPCLDADLCMDEAHTTDDMTRHEILMDRDFNKTLTDAQFERLQNDFAPPAQKKCYDPDLYMKCDGEANAHEGILNDKAARSVMLSAIYAGSMAFWYTGDEKYAENAAMWMRAWFGDSETRMNPRMTFAQGIPDTDISGQKFGLIEMQRLPTDVFECAELLKAGHSVHWSDADHEAVLQWQAEFLEWMKTSEMSNAAGDSYNNHATWEAFLRFYLGVRTGDFDEVWLAFGDITDKVMDTQFSTDALLPYEVFRPRSRHYYSYGMAPLVRAASVLKQYYNRFGDQYTNPEFFGNYLFTYKNEGTHVSLLDGMSLMHKYATEKLAYPFPDSETDWLKLDSGSIFGYEEIVLVGNKYAPSTPTDTYVEDLRNVTGYTEEDFQKSALRLMFRGEGFEKREY